MATIGRALGLAWTEVVLTDGSSASMGEVTGDPSFRVEMRSGREMVGEVRCGPERDGSLDDEERQLVATLAGQAALAIANARLASRIVTAAEEERRRIERNIHDGAQQELVALMGRLGMLSSLDGSVPVDEVGALQSDVKRILSDLRDLAQGIHPSVLSDGGLLEAVEECCSRLPIQVALHASSGLREARFGDDVEGAAYFFVAETLTNVLKHSGAQSAAVSLDHRGATLAMCVADDGVGFVPASVVMRGLTGLRDRLAALGGDVTVASRPGSTEISGVLPARVVA